MATKRQPALAPCRSRLRHPHPVRAALCWAISVERVPGTARPGANQLPGQCRSHADSWGDARGAGDRDDTGHLFSADQVGDLFSSATCRANRHTAIAHICASQNQRRMRRMSGLASAHAVFRRGSRRSRQRRPVVLDRVEPVGALCSGASASVGNSGRRKPGVHRRHRDMGNRRTKLIGEVSGGGAHSGRSNALSMRTTYRRSWDGRCSTLNTRFCARSRR